MGWINDGTWDGAASHAWIEFGGKKTDISLTRTSHPQHHPPGALLVLDHVVRPGRVSYQYDRHLSEAAAAGIERAAQLDEKLRMGNEMKQQQHATIAELASTPAGVKQYLDMAPPGGRYEDWVRTIG